MLRSWTSGRKAALTRHLRIFGASALAGIGLILPVQAMAFELDEFFVGRFTATGRFEARSASDSRNIRVTMVGTKTANGVALKEDMTLSDGERRQFTWTFRRAANGTLVATRPDIANPVPVVKQGETFTMSFVAPVKYNGSDYNVSFTETYRQVDENTVENKSTASYFITIGETTMIIRRAK